MVSRSCHPTYLVRSLPPVATITLKFITYDYRWLQLLRECSNNRYGTKSQATTTSRLVKRAITAFCFRAGWDAWERPGSWEIWEGPYETGASIASIASIWRFPRSWGYPKYPKSKSWMTIETYWNILTHVVIWCDLGIHHFKKPPYAQWKLLKPFLVKYRWIDNLRWFSEE